MSAVYISLLLILIAVSSAVLVRVRGLSRQLAAQAGAERDGALDEAAIRRAVSEALAADREREISEARAFWAEQEARAAEDDPLLDAPFPSGELDGPLNGLAGLGAENWPVFFPARPARRRRRTAPTPSTRRSARRCAPRWRA